MIYTELERSIKYDDTFLKDILNRTKGREVKV